MDRPGADRAQFPRRRRAGVAEDGPGSGGEHCGHPPSVDRQHAMTHRVHASMDHVEPRSPQAVVNRSRAEPKAAQLIP